jgi:hypothetical protein
VNVGDVVKLKPFHAHSGYPTDVFGIVLDLYEDEDGFYWYKVCFESVYEWFKDYELKLISATQSVDQ